jgi:LAGLIDADG endonuclease
MLILIKEYLKCGRIVIDNRQSQTVKYVVIKNHDLIKKIIPHFDNYPLVTSKFLNYSDFKIAGNVMKNKGHYTIDGINELRKIKFNMNKGRLFKDKFEFC